MGLTSTHIFAVLLAYIAFSYIRSKYRASRFRRFALANGCELPTYNHLNRLPWGVDGIYNLICTVSQGKDILDDLVIPRYRALNATTFVSTGLLGVRVIDTIEPANVQAMLAIQFKDFATGERRRTVWCVARTQYFYGGWRVLGEV
jgi:hypothetical protein